MTCAGLPPAAAKWNSRAGGDAGGSDAPGNLIAASHAGLAEGFGLASLLDERAARAEPMTETVDAQVAVDALGDTDVFADERTADL